MCVRSNGSTTGICSATAAAGTGVVPLHFLMLALARASGTSALLVSSTTSVTSTFLTEALPTTFDGTSSFSYSTGNPLTSAAIGDGVSSSKVVRVTVPCRMAVFLTVMVCSFDLLPPLTEGVVGIFSFSAVAGVPFLKFSVEILYVSISECFESAARYRRGFFHVVVLFCHGFVC